MSILIRDFSDIALFAAEVKPFLLRDEDTNNLQLSLIQYMSVSPNEIGTPIYRAVYNENEIAGVALRTGENRALICSHMPPNAIAPLWQSVSAIPVPIKEFNGPDDIVDLMVKESRLDFKVFMFLGAFRATKVIEPTAARGCLRLATLDDLDLLEQWNQEFALEALGKQDTTLRARIEAIILRSSMYIWHDDQTLLCQTYATQPMGTSIKITGVYTPKMHRGHGYASNCVAGVTKKLFADGYKKVFLFTDLMNPTSNSIYQKIGYEQFSTMKHVKLIEVI